MSGSTSIPALIRYAIDYGYEGAALSAFVRQRYQENLEDLQEEEERRRLDEEERLNELQWEEEIKLKERKWAIEARFYEFERSEWDSIKPIAKQEDEMLADTSISIAEKIIICNERIRRMTEMKARLQIAEQAMLEQLTKKNITILGPEPTPATPDTPTLPQGEDNTHDATLSHSSNFVKITSPAPTESSINTAPDASVDLNYANNPTTEIVSLIGPIVIPTTHTKPYQPLPRGKKFADERRIALGPELPVAAIQGADNQQSKLQLSPLATNTGSRPLRTESDLSSPTNSTVNYCVPGQNKNSNAQIGQRRQPRWKPRPPTYNLMKQRSKDTSLSYRETCRLLYSCCVHVYPSLITGASPFTTHPILSFDKSLSIT